MEQATVSLPPHPARQFALDQKPAGMDVQEHQVEREQKRDANASEDRSTETSTKDQTDNWSCAPNTTKNVTPT